MASAAGHKFGQLIGDFCERALEPLLRQFAAQHDLYLDSQGPRPARKGRKVTWVDKYGNLHDLDYVLERGGTPEKVGAPVAFIESAWRRYTKHSRNKAQEMQGAILPIAEVHRHCAPLVACVLAGVYTRGALDQLRSLGVKVLHFPYEMVVAAFRAGGIDASFDESTTEAEFESRLAAWGTLPDSRRNRIRSKLLKLNAAAIASFMESLELAVNRQIERLRVLPLHGQAVECDTVADAIEFVSGYQPPATSLPVVKFEIHVSFNNGDRIVCEFHDSNNVTAFLSAYSSGAWKPADKVS